MRYLILALFALFLVVVFAKPANAELCPEGLTCDTACGAPGIGLDRKGRTLPRDVGLPGVRVTAAGNWVTCVMPPDCPSKPIARWRSPRAKVNAPWCEPSGPAPDGRIGQRRQVAGYHGGHKPGRPPDGLLILQCQRDIFGATRWAPQTGSYCR